MKMKLCYGLILITSTLLFAGCDDDENGPKGEYEEGVFVVNEGAFNADNGSVTYYNTTTKVAEQNIFKNSLGFFAGDVVQSLTFSGDNGYLVINDDDKIEVVNGNTFTSISTITHADIEKPRYVEVINGKAYISVWGPYDDNFSLIDSYVLVYDLNSNTVLKKIDTDEGTEMLVYNGEKLFASNYNYGGSSTVSVINPADNSLIDEVEVSAGPAGMVLDANGKLWVVCVGVWGAGNGYLFRINPTTLEVEDEITITGIPGTDIAVTPDKQRIIYRIGTSVYSLGINATAEPAEPLFEAEEVISASTLNVDPATGNIWIGDAPSFTGIGKVYVYSASGDVITSFDAGIGPTQIVFK
jgi:YVTN family beta-propeller protein